MRLCSLLRSTRSHYSLQAAVAGTVKMPIGRPAAVLEGRQLAVTPDMAATQSSQLSIPCAGQQRRHQPEAHGRAVACAEGPQDFPDGVHPGPLRDAPRPCAPACRWPPVRYLRQAAVLLVLLFEQEAVRLCSRGTPTPAGGGGAVRTVTETACPVSPPDPCNII